MSTGNTEANAEEERGGGREGTKPTSIEDFAKIAALASTGLYGTQFLIYSTYYSAFGITPEEVGVTNAYLLPRAFGFAAILGVVFLCSITATIILRGFKDGPLGLLDLFRIITALGLSFGLGIFLAAQVVPRRANWLEWVFLLGLPVVTFATHLGLRKYPFGRGRSLVLVAVALAIAIPVTASVVIRAATAADCVRSGSPVGVIKIAGIPLLDISAQNVNITWLGDPTKKPAAVFDLSEPSKPASGILLGQSADKIIVRLDTGEIGRLPADQVASAAALPFTEPTRDQC